MIHIIFKVGLLATDPGGRRRADRLGRDRALWRAVVHLHAGGGQRRRQAAARPACARLGRVRQSPRSCRCRPCIPAATSSTSSPSISSSSTPATCWRRSCSAWPTGPRTMSHGAWSACVAWAAINAALVFSPASHMQPIHPVMGYAGLPGVHLCLALVGTAALCVIAALLTRLPFMNWLRWMGSQVAGRLRRLRTAHGHCPHAADQARHRRTDRAEPCSSWPISIISPLVLYWIVQRTGLGKFLFERPAWAHLPGTTQPPRRCGRHPGRVASCLIATHGGICDAVPLAFCCQDSPQGPRNPDIARTSR